MRRALVLVIAMLGIGCASNDDEVDREKCTKLRDRMIALRLAGLETSPDVNVAAHRDALAQSMGDEFIASCQRSLTASQIRCAMAADNLASAQECSRSSVATK